MWEVIMTPHPRGVLVQVTNGLTRSVVGRVEYRRAGHRPWRSFKAQLQRALNEAGAEAARMDEREAVGV